MSKDTSNPLLHKLPGREHDYLDFDNYLTNADTDTENLALPSTRRLVLYCKLCICPKYYAA